MPLEIIRNDITKVHADAIVNAANSALQQGGGVCGAIFAAAGADMLQKECDAIGGCTVGEAVMTKGYNLPARYIIHTVGPVWHGGQHGEEKLLAACYRNALMLAKKHQLESIAFPLISSGIFQYPKDKALKVAIATIGDFLLQNEMIVYLVVFDKATFVLSERIFSSIKQYIDDRYIDEHRPLLNRSIRESERNRYFVKESMQEMPAPLFLGKNKRSLHDLVTQPDETFSQMLLRLIDEKRKSDVEIYKKANIDRKLFSKIRSDIGANIDAIATAASFEIHADKTAIERASSCRRYSALRLR